MTRYVLAVAILEFVLIAGCGSTGANKDPVIGPPPVDCDQVGNKLGLALFAATDCVPCAKELPDLQNRLATQLGNQGCRVTTTVYLTDAAPTAEQVSEWKGRLGLQFPIAYDPYCKKEFKKYYTGGCAMPAGALLAEDGTKIKVYPKGSVDLDDLMAQIKQRLN